MVVVVLVVVVGICVVFVLAVVLAVYLVVVSFLSRIRRSPRSTLYPYTTHLRSRVFGIRNRKTAARTLLFLTGALSGPRRHWTRPVALAVLAVVLVVVVLVVVRVVVLAVVLVVALVVVLAFVLAAVSFMS